MEQPDQRQLDETLDTGSCRHQVSAGVASTYLAYHKAHTRMLCGMSERRQRSPSERPFRWGGWCWTSPGLDRRRGSCWRIRFCLPPCARLQRGRGADLIVCNEGPDQTPEDSSAVGNVGVPSSRDCYCLSSSMLCRPGGLDGEVNFWLVLWKGVRYQVLNEEH